MSNFDKAYDHLLKDEGGYVFDPDDPGGETFRGISRENFPMWEGWATVDLYISDSIVKNTTNSRNKIESDEYLSGLVKAFYKKEFWDKLCCDEIVHQGIAELIFNFSVNTGPSSSVKAAQKALGVNVDGGLGKNTLAAINSVENYKYFEVVFKINLVDHYIKVVNKRPTSIKYLKGWIARVLRA